MAWKVLRKLSSLLFLSVLLSSSVACSEDVAPKDMDMETLSSTIREKLTDLRRNSAVVTEQLRTLSESLEKSQAEASQWKEQSMRLSDSLTSISEELTKCYGSMREYEETITLQKQRLRTQIKMMWILIGILALRVLSMIVGFILYGKGITLPRWLDILL